MVSEQQQRYSSDKGDAGKFDDTQLLVKDAAATTTAATMVLLPSAVSKEEGHDGNNSTKQGSSILERKRVSFPASSFEFVPILKRAKVVSASSKKKEEEWELTPVSILIRILGYLDNTTLMNMCLVCKQIKTIIWNGQGMEHQLVRILELRPSDNHDNDRIRMQTFFDNMNRYVQDDTKKRMLQGYQHWKIYDPKRIIQYMACDNNLEKFAQNVRLNGIVSLDVSSPVPTTCVLPWPKFFRLISFVVPNLRHLDLSKTRMSTTTPKHFITAISGHLPFLETIKWNDLPTWSHDSRLTADGAGLESIRTLKEFHLDNNKFSSYSRIQNNGGNNNDNDGDDNPRLLDLRVLYPSLFRIHHPQLRLGDNGTNTAAVPTEFEAMSDLNKHPQTFLFYKLCHKALEGVSIRNMTACFFDDGENHPLHHPLPQTALVKFVRNAPTTLKWFRSDLTQDNITMLQSERPGIKFLN